VDDNPAIHADFKKILIDERTDTDELKQAAAGLLGGTVAPRKQSRFDLTSAYQGKEGLVKVQEAMREGRPFEMAFVDVRMPPGWDGIETIERLWEESPDLPMVICTAYSDYALDDILAKLGLSDKFVILKKPFDPVEAVQLANAMTEKWRLLQRVRERTQRLVASEESLRQAQTQLEMRVQERTQELAAAKARLQAVLNGAALVSIVATDLQGLITVFNTGAERMLGYTAAEMIGVHTPCFFHLESELRARAKELRGNQAGELTGLAALVETALHGEHVEREWTYVRKDGTHLTAKTVVTALRDSTGEIIGFLKIAKDVTPEKLAERERQEMEMQLRQAHKLEAIGQLAAGIAHEINTPTQYVGDNLRFVRDSFESVQAVIDSYRALLAAAKSGQLTAKKLDEAEQVVSSSDVDYLEKQIPAALNDALEGVGRITKIVASMKEFSHPGGKDRSPVNLNHAIETTVTVARNEWKYVADMQLELDPDLPAVPCFLGEFNQAILNLIVNAAHAVGDVVQQSPDARGTITVRTRRLGDQVEVQVSDTGTGIPVAIQPRLFEPFFTTKGVGKGTGQGLSLVYGNVVKKHGGSVHFESKEGHGTTFFVRLPLAAATADPEADPCEACGEVS